MGNAKLEMAFADEEGKQFKLTLNEPREDITETEVRQAMDDVVAKNIFYTAVGDVVSVIGARIITTVVDELEI